MHTPLRFSFLLFNFDANSYACWCWQMRWTLDGNAMIETKDYDRKNYNDEYGVMIKYLFANKCEIEEIKRSKKG